MSLAVIRQHSANMTCRIVFGVSLGLPMFPQLVRHQRTFKYTGGDVVITSWFRCCREKAFR